METSAQPDPRDRSLPSRSPHPGEGLLVLDIGSSSVRATLYRRDGDRLVPGGGAQRYYDWRTHPAGAMEREAEVVLERVVAAIDAALPRARAEGLEIVAVAIAAFWHSLLALDASGEPLTPVLAWGDTRATGEALRLLEPVDEQALHRRTGCFLHPSYPSVKLSWLRRQDPETFRRAAAWVSFPEYLEQRLLGRRRCSFSMASGSGLLDVHRLEWDGEAMDMAGVRPAVLSELVDADAALQGLVPEFASRWPELARADWYPALGDGACANLGSGAVGLDRIGVTIGTSAAVRALWRPEGGDSEVPERLWCYRLDRQWWIAGGALSNGGNAVAFLRGLLALPPAEERRAAVAGLEPDAHGLTILPFLVGERGPGWVHETRSVVVGMRPSTPPEHLLRAWMEAIAYRIADLCAELGRVLDPEPRIYASGGALHASPVWAQILADVLGRSVLLPAEREATSLGAALVAQAHRGWVDGLHPPAAEATRYEPDAADHQRYQEARERQASLEAALAPWLSLVSPSSGEEDDS